MISEKSKTLGKNEQYCLLFSFTIQFLFVCLITIIIYLVPPRSTEPTISLNLADVALYFIVYSLLIYFIIKVMKMKPDDLKEYYLYEPFGLLIFSLTGIGIVVIGAEISAMIMNFGIFHFCLTLVIEVIILCWIKIDNRHHGVNWFWYHWKK